MIDYGIGAFIWPAVGSFADWTAQDLKGIWSITNDFRFFLYNYQAVIIGALLVLLLYIWLIFVGMAL